MLYYYIGDGNIAQCGGGGDLGCRRIGVEGYKMRKGLYPTVEERLHKEMKKGQHSSG